jgi:hypothetical protein
MDMPIISSANNNTKSLASQRFAIFSAYQKQQIQVGQVPLEKQGQSGNSSQNAESTVNIPHNMTHDDRNRNNDGEGFLSPVNEVSVNNKQTPNTMLK